MFKSTIFFALLLITFASCSNDSIVDPLVDDYTGNYLTSLSNMTERFEDVSVSELSGDRIEINLGKDPGTLIGTVDEYGGIEMGDFQGTFENGTELRFSEATGQFNIDTIHGTQTPIKTILLSFNNDQGTNISFLQLVEKI